jgi:hypothetical protein
VLVFGCTVCSCYGEGADDVFTNNTCVAREHSGCPYWPTYASDAPMRNGPAAPNFRVGDNTILAGPAVLVGAGGNVTLQDWQALGHDAGAIYFCHAGSSRSFYRHNVIPR